MNLLFLILLLIPSVCSAQYVTKTLEDRIKNDKVAIALDQADIATKQADIDSIVNDQSADTVTSQLKEVQDIKAKQLDAAGPVVFDNP